MLDPGDEYRFQELVLHKLNTIISILGSIQEEETKMSAQLDDLIVIVQNTEGVEDSAIALLQGLSADIATLAAELAAQGIDNQKLVDLGVELDTKTAALAAAVAANPVPPTP
jgi:ABC-type sulfate transport system substrate-binding protein